MGAACIQWDLAMVKSTLRATVFYTVVSLPDSRANGYLWYTEVRYILAYRDREKCLIVGSVQGIRY